MTEENTEMSAAAGRTIDLGINAIDAAEIVYSAAIVKYAPLEPKPGALSSSPATTGPNTRDAVLAIIVTAMALPSRASGTRSATSD